MVRCKSFDMWSMSLSQIFGKTPKISFVCGECGAYSEGRIPVRAVEMGKPYIKCNCCDEVNYIPIVYGNNNYDDDDFLD